MAYGMPLQRDPTNVMGRRIVAYAIDLVLLFGIGVAILAATKDQVFTGAPANACQSLRAGGVGGTCIQIGSRVYLWKGSGIGLGYGLGAVASFLDLVVLQAAVGASIGKLIMGLRVVDAQGQKAGFGAMLLRWIVLIFVDNLCFLIGLLTASLTHPHRRVGDMAANTYVVALADLGRPVFGPAFAGQYGAYGQPGPAGWVPPGAAPPGAPGWGAPPPAAYGGQPTQPGGWTAPPPPQPTWGAPPSNPPGWGAPPPSPQQAPGWGATPPASANPPGWAEPTPPPPAAPSEPGPLGWDSSPAPSTSAPAPPPAPPAPAPEPPAADPGAPAEGESWWNKAINKDDEPDK